jgi:hypothetical protein
MIKVDSIEREFCLPCADKLEIEGVIVEREGECLECKPLCGDHLVPVKDCGCLE